MSIDAGEYKQKIRFVSMHRQDLRALPLLEYVHVMDGYAEALFEMGNYERHLRIADHIIELSIVNNIIDIGDKDIYFETLFQKAASYYNLNKTDEAIHILVELLKMKPRNESCRLFLINCFVRQQSKVLNLIRRISIVAIMASAMIIAVELLLIRTVFPDMTQYFEPMRNTLFIAGASSLIVGELAVRYKAVSRMLQMVK